MSDLSLSLLILLVTVGLFVSDRLRMDLVALMMLLALLLTGLVSPSEALAGFSDPVVVMIAGLFVIGGAILQTGTAQEIGNLVSRLSGHSEARLITVLMLAVAGLSAFMSSTGTAAVFLPIVLALAQQNRIAPSRLLMPMAFAAFLGGMLTLIGTPPNLMVSNTLRAAGLKGFALFDFALPGAVALAVALAYMLLIGRHLLPGAKVTAGETATAPSTSELLTNYAVAAKLAWFRLPPGELTERPLAELALPEHYGIEVLCSRKRQGLWDARSHFCRASTQLEAGQEVLLHGESYRLNQFVRHFGLKPIAKRHQHDRLGGRHLGLAEVLLLPRSELMGKSLVESGFRERYRLHVLAIMRQGKLLDADFARVPLRFADLLLVQGPWERLRALQLKKRDFSVLHLPDAAISQANPLKIGLTLAWVGFMLTAMIFAWMPLVAAVLLTALGLVLSRCLSMEEAYRSISWESVILIAAMLPLSTALQNSGGTAAFSAWLGQTLGGYGPYSIMAVLFGLTSVCSLFISNTATTVLIAPLALQLALSMGFEPRTFLMVVALGASSAFATPMSSPVNTMVLGPGGYRFGDYVKVGLPLQVLMLGVSLLIVPWAFGLKP